MTLPSMGERTVVSDMEIAENDRQVVDILDDSFELQDVKELYDCSLCGFNATGPLGIIEHIQTHSRESPWDCARCTNALNGKQVDEPHDSCCLDQLERLNSGVKCCQEILIRPKSREQHKCTLCPFKSTCLSEVVVHIGKHMRKRKHLELDEEEASGNKTWDIIYTCTECEFSCVRPDKLEKHMEGHAPDAKFMCMDCGSGAPTRKSLQTHKRTVHGFVKPFECTLCAAKFTRLDNLKTHIKKHMGQHRYACKMCKYSAPTKARLITHYNGHKDGSFKDYSKERPTVNCPVCWRPYSNYQSLQVHRKTHVLTPPFTCHPCQVEYDTSSQLFDHHTSHVDAQALSCAFCDFMCFDDSTIHNHLGAFHGSEKPFQCEICNYRFSSLVHWKRHQLVHTGEKPFSCELCSAKFSQSGNRKAHMIKIHNLFIPLPKTRRKIKAEHQEEIVIDN